MSIAEYSNVIDHLPSIREIRNLHRAKTGTHTHGDVFLLHHTGNEGVVLKLLFEKLVSDQAFQSGFLKAAAIAAKLEHPNFVRVFGAKKVGNQVVLAMQYADKGSLSDVLDKADDNKLSLDKAVRVLAGICAALEYAHEKRITHWNIKPGSVLLTRNDQVKLDAFDLVMAMMEAHGGGNARDTEVKGLGSVFYEMVTGLPYDEDTTRLGIIRPGKLRKVIRRSLESGNGNPYRNVSQFCEDFKRSLPKSGGVLVALGDVYRTAKQRLTIRWEYPVELDSDYYPSAIRLNRDGDVYLLLSSRSQNAGLVYFYDKRFAGKARQEYSIEGIPINAFLSDNGGILYIVIRGQTNELRILEWDTSRKKWIQDWYVPGDGIRQILRIRNDGRFLLVEENQLVIWDAFRGQSKAVNAKLRNKEIILAAYKDEGGIRIISSLIKNSTSTDLCIDISRFVLDGTIFCRHLDEQQVGGDNDEPMERSVPAAGRRYLGFRIDDLRLFFFDISKRSVVSVKLPYNYATCASTIGEPTGELAMLNKDIAKESLLWWVGNRSVAVAIQQNRERFVRIYPLTYLHHILGVG